MSLDKADIGSVRASWQQFTQQNKWNYVLLVYRILFNKHPQYKALFPHDLEDIRDNILKSVNYLMDHLDQPAELQPEFERLGIIHSECGVKPDMFADMVKCHAQALREVKGDDVSVEDVEHWKHLFQFFANGIIKAYPGQL